MLVPATAVPAAAQRHTWDGSLGLSGSAWRAAVGAFWQVDIGGLRLGAGPRLTHFAGNASNYRGRGSLPAGIPSRLALAPDVWALNLAVSGQLRLAGPLAAGANLDLVGVAAGPSRIAAATRLEPSRGSLFLYGDRDRGSLNSEFFVAVTVGRQLSVRAGVSHYVTGYRIADRSASGHYLRFDTVPFLGVRWAP
jgi:hypothetical protein